MVSLVIEEISDLLTDAGFSVKREYIGDIADDTGELFPAFLRVDKIELCELIQTMTYEHRCREEITFQIRALGRAAGFSDAEELEEMTEDAVMRLYLLEDMLIKKIVCGGVKKNMTLGRLEQTIEFTAVVTVGMGTGVSE